jgi:excinuclease ABC subunit A
VHGGHIIAEGTPAQILANKKSLTGKYLSGVLNIPIPAARRKPAHNRWLKVVGARGNNLKNVTAPIPLGPLTCITGVAGGGKSTLTIETLYKAAARKLTQAREHPAPHDRIEGLEFLDKVIDIDQSPIGRTPRSNPATYTQLFTAIRNLMSQTAEARMRGYGPGRFSFNVKGGRCEACEGDGVRKVEMHFLPDVYVTCEVCRGRRYNEQTLRVEWKGKNIAQVLETSVTDAFGLFEHHRQLNGILRTLDDVGLGYIALGQSATTLSGGEAQRIKLSRELAKRDTGRTMYLLDEPTTGLHFEDVQRLLAVLRRLTEAGNTVLVIEHNLDVIKVADYIIDVGPEGGSKGGLIVAAGTPEEVARTPGSFTGQFLAPMLGLKRGRRATAA